MIEDDRNPAQVLAALGLKTDAADQEIEAAGRHLDRDAPQDAE